MSEHSIEQWRPVVGFEGFYEVSNHGRVRRSADGPRTFIGRILKQNLLPDGYFAIQLSAKGKRLSTTVHRLVCRAFLGPTPEGKEINHIDTDKTNNRADNFEFITHAENMRHAKRAGVLRPRCGMTNGRSKITDDDVREIRRMRAAGVLVKDVISKFKIKKSMVGYIVKRTYWKHIA